MSVAEIIIVGVVLSTLVFVVIYTIELGKELKKMRVG